VEATGGRVETLVTNSQYSSRRFREKVADCGVVAVIPYPSYQAKGEDVAASGQVYQGPWFGGGKEAVWAGTAVYRARAEIS
jgi:hypothetical protein